MNSEHEVSGQHKIDNSLSGRLIKLENFNCWIVPPREKIF